MISIIKEVYAKAVRRHHQLEMFVSIREAYMIRNGKIAELIRQVVLTEMSSRL